MFTQGAFIISDQFCYALSVNTSIFVFCAITGLKFWKSYLLKNKIQATPNTMYVCAEIATSTIIRPFLAWQNTVLLKLVIGQLLVFFFFVMWIMFYPFDRWFPDCSYLLKKRGDNYVMDVHARTPANRKVGDIRLIYLPTRPTDYPTTHISIHYLYYKHELCCQKGCLYYNKKFTQFWNVRTVSCCDNSKSFYGTDEDGFWN